MEFMGFIDKCHDRMLESGALERGLEDWKAKDDRLKGFDGISALMRACSSHSEKCRREKDRFIAGVSRFAKDGDEVASALLLKLFIGVFRRVARRLGPNPLDPQDLESEMLQAFWEELARSDSEDRLSTRLFYAVLHRAWRVVKGAEDESRRQVNFDPEVRESFELRRSQGGLLHEAILSGIISESQADLIASTRVEGGSISDFARASGISREAAGMRRQRAEEKLVRYLESKNLPA